MTRGKLVCCLVCLCLTCSEAAVVSPVVFPRLTLRQRRLRALDRKWDGPVRRPFMPTVSDLRLRALVVLVELLTQSRSPRPMLQKGRHRCTARNSSWTCA